MVRFTAADGTRAVRRFHPRKSGSPALCAGPRRVAPLCLQPMLRRGSGSVAIAVLVAMAMGCAAPRPAPHHVHVPPADADAITVSWVGHATVLIGIGGRWIL